MTDLSGTHNYQYDEIYRLTSATHPTAENVPESFSYDSVGNRTTSHISTTYSYNSANQLLSDDKFIYSYDGNGNLFEKKEKATNKTTRYIYNSEDQLIQIILSDGKVVKYGYDALGRRIWKEAGGVITKYVYDNEDIIFEYDKNNYIIARYTHGPGIDEPLVMERGGKSYFYYFDGLGSVTQIVDSSGNVINSYIYDSFGNIKEKTEGVKNSYTYTSREYDEESGLYYYRARYYDGKVGRFLQLDKVSLTITYQYSYNNPLIFVESEGLEPKKKNEQELSPLQKKAVEIGLGKLLEDYTTDEDLATIPGKDKKEKIKNLTKEIVEKLTQDEYRKFMEAAFKSYDYKQMENLLKKKAQEIKK